MSPVAVSPSLAYPLVIPCSSSKDPRRRNATYFYTELGAFSLYYGIDDNIDDERVLRLQSLLDLLDTRPHDLFFNPKDRLRILTPKCSDILVSCRLGGRPFDCMQEFRETLSSFGFCCTFNYNGRYVNCMPSDLDFNSFGV